VVQVVREWLPLAEAELKFRAMPEDEDSLVQLLENHEVRLLRHCGGGQEDKEPKGERI